MEREPLLASRGFPAGHDGYNVPLVCKVHGGLHYIKGNSAPYFSLTYDQHRKGFPNQASSGGTGHDYILKYWPQFADLAALHLSDIDGVPMYAEANGWYKLAGSLPDAFGEQYHSGNSQQHFPDGYRLPTGDECLAMFAEHCRIPLAEARKIRQSIMTRGMNAKDNRLAIAKAELAAIMDTMRPRWKAEADACIAKHGLRVYGDAWPVAKAG